ncbi:alanyl-tRNA editing protein [Halovenus salina]|uniref:Alanyl-tRNA editing protein n=1 Tax=Halovenus salina TaxID=1510225 RepID=A0ABD5W326_9EURY|nr:alanine--tRNA ligase-related protein [Halovenus salina]
MTETKASADPYTTQFEAVVEQVTDSAVVLDETYFYPEGGGQPADRGTLAGQEVVDVQHGENGVVHTLAEASDLTVGETVTGNVDESFRTYCMRAHTASHVVYGAGRRMLDDLGYGGFDISPEKVRVDFTTSTEIDDEVLLELERLANQAVWESRSVTWERYPEAEALDMERIAFNTKTEEGLGGDTVRVVTVGGSEPWDVAACGGTHVENTQEIGPITVIERSNPGEGMTRVEFAVGEPAIGRRIEEKAAAFEAAATAGTNLAGLSEYVRDLQSDIERLEAERGELQDQLAERRIDDLRDDVVEREGGTWLAGSVDAMGPNDLSEKATEMAGEAADVVALAGQDGRTFVAVAAAEGFDAGAIVDEVTEEFGGGGGGSPAAAQGGGIDATPGAVVDFLQGGMDE